MKLAQNAKKINTGVLPAKMNVDFVLKIHVIKMMENVILMVIVKIKHIMEICV